MKTKLMKTMANAIVIPTALAILTLTAQAQKLDHPVRLDAGTVQYVAVDILNVHVTKNANHSAEVKAIDGVEEIEPINFDQHIIALDRVKSGGSLELADVILGGQEVQALDALNIARTIHY